MEEYKFVGIMSYADFCAKYAKVSVLWSCGLSIEQGAQVEVYESGHYVAIDKGFRLAEYTKC